MKMNKILSILMFVIALSALAIKGQTFPIDDLDKTTKENVDFSETMATQQTFNVKTLAMIDLEEICRMNKSLISYSPPSLYFDAMGGTSVATLRFIPNPEYNTSCGAFGPIISLKQFQSSNFPYPVLNYMKYGISSNSSLTPRTFPISIGGKQMQIVQGLASTTPFSLLNWVKGKILNSIERKQCKANDPENPCTRDACMCIRG